MLSEIYPAASFIFLLSNHSSSVLSFRHPVRPYRASYVMRASTLRQWEIPAANYWCCLTFHKWAFPVIINCKNLLIIHSVKKKSPLSLNWQKGLNILRYSSASAIEKFQKKWDYQLLVKKCLLLYFTFFFWRAWFHQSKLVTNHSFC